MPAKKKSLVIVESPTKAKTIAKYLGPEFVVLSSFGHVRDLPKKDLGVDVEHDFKPKYVIPLKAKKVVSELKKAAAKANMVYFASDEDREGEAIAWHLREILDLPAERVKRITFHEITEHAIQAALEHPRAIDEHLVDAQQARRVLDRLVGYKLSPFLWHKVARGLSAGRVQSVIVRLIVEREREITAFNPQEYWSIEAQLRKNAETATFTAKLSKKDGETLDKFALANEDAAKKVAADVDGAAWTVTAIEKKRSFRSAPAPFTTSTLQQEANNKLGFSAKQTMMIAQQLYEGVELGSQGHVGLITYMRTDSQNLSEKFLGEARDFILAAHGKDFCPDVPKKFKTKSKGAQEAHEAIRPTTATLRPEDLKEYLDSRQLKLYELIWQRAIASQMTDAEIESSGINIDARKTGAPLYTFRATGQVIIFKGFLEVYDMDTKDNLLPSLAENETLAADAVEPKQHFTEPPPRYTEAAIVKALEENGVGRPSTYAPTLSTVVDRGYVEKDGRKLKPTDLAFLVNDLLVAHFPDIVDMTFTARMEEHLDDIAEGKEAWAPVIKEFYEPFEKNLMDKEKEVSKKDITETATDVVCEKCGKPMIIKFGRFGKFLACTGFPECRNTKQIKADGEITETPTTDEKCPTCGAPMMVKQGRFGAFLSCTRYPDCKTVKPIQKKTGVKCPSCNQGDIIEKKTRKGKMFFACSRYPECSFALWSKPTGEMCPKCNSLLVFAKNDIAKCSNKECDFEKEIAAT